MSSRPFGYIMDLHAWLYIDKVIYMYYFFLGKKSRCNGLLRFARLASHAVRTRTLSPVTPTLMSHLTLGKWRRRHHHIWPWEFGDPANIVESHISARQHRHTRDTFWLHKLELVGWSRVAFPTILLERVRKQTKISDRQKQSLTSSDEN